jgi:hypothetical protein
MKTKAPNFWECFAEAVRISASERSIVAILPWWLLICCVTPVSAIYLLYPVLRLQVSDSDTITILSAISVIGAFFGSVSVATIGHVQKMASEYPFSSYLKDEKLFDLFLFWPQLTLFFQLALILISSSLAISVRVGNLDHLHKYFIALDFGLLVYVCTKTWNLIELVRKLAWHYEQYNRLFAEEKQKAE